MGLIELGPVLAAVVVTVGAAGGLAVGVAKSVAKLMAKTYVEQVKHELRQETESYRTKLRKSEFLFEKEFEAASEFIDLHRRLSPKIRYPDEEWDEAVNRFGSNLEQVEQDIGEYLSVHGAALQEPAQSMVRNALDKAEYGKFEWHEDEPARRIAEDVLNRLKEIEAELLRAVWAQSST